MLSKIATSQSSFAVYIIAINVNGGVKCATILYRKFYTGEEGSDALGSFFTQSVVG